MFSERPDMSDSNQFFKFLVVRLFSKFAATKSIVERKIFITLKH